MTISGLDDIAPDLARDLLRYNRKLRKIVARECRNRSAWFHAGYAAYLGGFRVDDPEDYYGPGEHVAGYKAAALKYGSKP